MSYNRPSGDAPSSRILDPLRFLRDRESVPTNNPLRAPNRSTRPMTRREVNINPFNVLDRGV
jgi:hypothetical protein